METMSSEQKTNSGADQKPSGAKKLERIRVSEACRRLSIGAKKLDAILSSNLFTVVRDGSSEQCTRYVYADEIDLYLTHLPKGYEVARLLVKEYRIKKGRFTKRRQ